VTDIEIPVGKRTKSYRFFEILPASLSWLILLLPAIVSFFNPELTAYLVLIFMAQYLIKAGIMAIRVVIGYRQMRWRQDLRWVGFMEDLEDPDASMRRLEGEQPSRAKQWHYRQLAQFVDSREERLRPNQLYHIVFVAMVNEPLSVLRPTLQALAKSEYDMEKVIVYIAYELRAGEEAENNAKTLEKEFADTFFKVKAVGHPADLPNEVVGKGGNITFAAREFEKYMKQQKMQPEHILVTTLDSDNRVHTNYLNSVAYAYITTPNRHNHSYQPIPMYLNNIWDTAAPARMIATGSSFWWSVQSTRPHQLRNFSSHAQPMTALLQTNYWSSRTIVEDGHQYWRTYFAFDGQHDVIPTFVPIYQDAVLSGSYRHTLKAQFIQLRRWAYGASDIAYVATKAFFTKNDVPKLDASLKLLRLVETHVSWATAPLILAGAAWAPILANPDGRDSIVAHQLPGIAALLQTVALLGVPVMIYLSFQILPKRPARYKRHRTFGMLIQWVLLPPLSIIYGAFTALYSQTRLLLGKYLDKFDLTEKHVQVDD